MHDPPFPFRALSVESGKTVQVTHEFDGENIHKMDGKGRVSIPASYRAVLAEGDPKYDHEAMRFVLIYSDRGNKCLEGFTIKGKAEITALIAKLPRFSKKRAYLRRWLNAQSVTIPVEASGRFVLPEKLRDKFGIEAGEIMFAGMGDSFQIWSPEDYAADTAAMANEFGAYDDPNNPFAMLDSIADDLEGEA